ncbi:MAG: MazG family protein [Verrucomicrobia bacterium]|nr:MazG family protein [Verrucomicrobiota bacterium]
MKPRPIDELLDVVRRLRGPKGCPWDRQQTHKSIRYHLIEEAYEVLDSIDANDDESLEEELGDVLLHVVLHSQIASERGAFDFNAVTRRIVKKLIFRHPHVFGSRRIRSADAVLAQWDRLKAAEKESQGKTRTSALDGIPRYLPALERAQKLWKKAVKANLVPPGSNQKRRPERGHAAKALPSSQRAIGKILFDLACCCQEHGWHAEDLLRREIKRLERVLRRTERASRPRSRRTALAVHGQAGSND